MPCRMQLVSMDEAELYWQGQEGRVLGPTQNE
jgi:hypothetical protein